MLDFKEDIVVGEIEAWRVWRFTKDEEYLRSLFMTEGWIPGQPMEGDPSKPAAGVYSFKSKQNAINYSYTASPCVIGKVDIWGKVVEHKIGYRSEYAQITKIDTVFSGLLHSKRWARDQKVRLCKLYDAADGDGLSKEEKYALWLNRWIEVSLGLAVGAVCFGAMIAGMLIAAAV